MIPFVRAVEKDSAVTIACRWALIGALVCAFAGTFSSPGYAQKRGGGGLTNNPPPELVRAEQEEVDFSAVQTALGMPTRKSSSAHNSSAIMRKASIDRTYIPSSYRLITGYKIGRILWDRR